jgi:putative ABC transport system ATP-binding protein
MLKPIISTQLVSKTVSTVDGDLHILENISLEIFKGEAVAIIGASGSGKSTLLSLLAGLDQPTSGEITLFEQSLQNLNEDQRAQLRAGQIGFVFQSFQLLPALTALENVMLSAELIGMKKPKELAIESLSAVGLKERLYHTPNQLSGGEQQRVAIARAFVTNPQILFADEPTGNLDQKTGEKIIELLFQLREQKETTLVLVTHDNTLAQQCNKHYQLIQGKIHAG